MLRESKVCRIVFAGLVTLALSTFAVLLSGCPEEGFEPEPMEPVEPQEPMEIPEEPQEPELPEPDDQEQMEMPEPEEQ